MDENLSLNQNVDTLFTNMENFTQNEGLIGKPVIQGDKTFIPVVSVTIGYGSGSSENKDKPGASTPMFGTATGAGNKTGGALGLGAKLSTEGIIVIDNNVVSFMPVSAPGNASQIIDKIPQIINNMNANGQQQNQQPNQQ